jgi:hypothetical protein
MWKAKTKDGKEVSELNTAWGDIKDNISELLLLTEKNQVICLPKNLDYIQYKTASANLGGGSVQVESRTIGFKVGDKTVKVIVDEKTQNIRIELK